MIYLQRKKYGLVKINWIKFKLNYIYFDWFYHLNHLYFICHSKELAFLHYFWTENFHKRKQDIHGSRYYTIINFSIAFEKFHRKHTKTVFCFPATFFAIILLTLPFQSFVAKWICNFPMEFLHHCASTINRRWSY